IGLSRTWGVGGPEVVAMSPQEQGAQPESYYNPLKTEEAFTIGERDFRAEIAAAYLNQPDESDLYVIPDLTVGWGIGPWADLQFEFQYLKVQNTMRFDRNEGVIEDNIDEVGKGDVRVKLKASPLQCKYGRFGVQLVTKVPSAEDEDALGTDEMDVITRGLFSTDWSQLFADGPLRRLKTHLNAGLAIQGDRNRLASQRDYFLWGVAMEYDLMRSLTLWAEAEGSTNGKSTANISEGDFGDSYAEGRVGLTGPLPQIAFIRDWKWGVTTSTGLSKESRDWTASAGLSHTWGL
ncbi:MAG: hypothetical protein HY801_03445, partial [Candidatus Lindowbacteria bacterium]|nr:hypothetical protein [Candidatus Lindowbacteria bacterium]